MTAVEVSVNDAVTQSAPTSGRTAYPRHHRDGDSDERTARRYPPLVTPTRPVVRRGLRWGVAVCDHRLSGIGRGDRRSRRRQHTLADVTVGV